MLSIASGQDFLAVKGILELVLARLNPAATLEVVDFRHELFAPARACELRLDGQRFGFLGEISADGAAAIRAARPGDGGRSAIRACWRKSRCSCRRRSNCRLIRRSSAM